MKKIIISMCAALAALGVSAQQSGDMAVGLNLGVAPCLEKNASLTNFGVGAKFQYNITDPLRLEAAFDYGFKAKGCDVFTLGVNAHYIFKIGEKFNVYPLVGLGYAHLGAGSASGKPVIEFPGGKEPDFSHWGMMSSRAGSATDPSQSQGSVSANKFFFNVGAGAEYALNSTLSVGAEIKYQYIKNFSRLPISLGVTYRF